MTTAIIVFSVMAYLFGVLTGLLIGLIVCNRAMDKIRKKYGEEK